MRTPERYIAAVGAGKSPMAAEEILDRAARRLEALELAIRTSRGVPKESVPDDPALGGLVEEHGDFAVLTLRGRLLANEVTIRLDPGRVEPAGILRR